MYECKCGRSVSADGPSKTTCRYCGERSTRLTAGRRTLGAGLRRTVGAGVALARGDEVVLEIKDEPPVLQGRWHDWYRAMTHLDRARRARERAEEVKWTRVGAQLDANPGHRKLNAYDLSPAELAEVPHDIRRRVGLPYWW